MKSALALLSLASVAVVSAAPNDGAQLRVGIDQVIAETAENVFGDVFRGAEHILDAVLHTGEETMHKVEEKIQEWSVGNTEFVKQDNIVCECYQLGGSRDVDRSLDERFRHASFPGYQIRLKKPQLCDPTVKQYSGYLDISDDKHLFFWCVFIRIPPSELAKLIIQVL